LELDFPFDFKDNAELQRLICKTPHKPLSKGYSSTLRDTVDKMLGKVFVMIVYLIIFPEQKFSDYTEGTSFAFRDTGMYFRE
jgi:hypothetical protein